MKHKLFIMTISAALLASCSGNKVAEQWAKLPLSPETDAAQLAAQIKANPGDWEAAAQFLQREDLASIELGKHQLTENGCFANVQEYNTKLESNYEAHKDYIDIQVVLAGKEHIFVAPIADAAERLTDYDPVKDIEFFASAANEKPVLADKDNWVILFPLDAHMPCMTIGEEPTPIRKIVIKVPFVK